VDDDVGGWSVCVGVFDVVVAVYASVTSIADVAAAIVDGDALDAPKISGCRGCWVFAGSSKSSEVVWLFVSFSLASVPILQVALLSTISRGLLPRILLCACRLHCWEGEVTARAKGKLLERSLCFRVASWNLMCTSFGEDIEAEVNAN